MMAHDPSLWAGGAALNALDEQERAEFDVHLSDCAFCEAELVGFSETAARLGSALAEPAPASMRAGVMAMVAVTRQLPPEIPHASDGDTHRALGSADSEPPSYRPVAPSDVVSEPLTTPVSIPYPAPEKLASVTDLSTRRRFSGRLLLAAAAVVAVAVAGAAIFLNTSKPAQVADPLLQCVTTAADRTQVTAAQGSVGTSDVTLSASCGAALVQLTNVPAAPAGHTYQLWVVAGTVPRSVGTMNPDSTGTMPDTIAPLHVGDTAIGVTVEPTGGSPVPTLPMVVQVPLAA